ncbi:hypothetical protein CRG98_028794 [Punica granatum]|uniref:Uncharacterized protein n=1 Tax=Punica granatum TaxID=22663 RepID=A0A2I0J3I7_PUNGR|nr:hypothetical protein CRG98_028794 [Punica granatum]
MQRERERVLDESSDADDDDAKERKAEGEEKRKGDEAERESDSPPSSRPRRIMEAEEKYLVREWGILRCYQAQRCGLVRTNCGRAWGNLAFGSIIPEHVSPRHVGQQSSRRWRRREPTCVNRA